MPLRPTPPASPGFTPSPAQTPRATLSPRPASPSPEPDIYAPPADTIDLLGTIRTGPNSRRSVGLPPPPPGGYGAGGNDMGGPGVDLDFVPYRHPSQARHPLEPVIGPQELPPGTLVRRGRTSIEHFELRVPEDWESLELWLERTDFDPPIVWPAYSDLTPLEVDRNFFAQAECPITLMPMPEVEEPVVVLADLVQHLFAYDVLKSHVSAHSTNPCNNMPLTPQQIHRVVLSPVLAASAAEPTSR